MRLHFLHLGPAGREIRGRLAVACAALIATGSGRADVFANVPEAAAYEVAYELAIPVNGAFQGTTAVPYTVDNAETAAPDGFDRVAYYLELTGTSGTSWAYASMDAFTTVATRTGLPHDTNNPVSFQQGVANLTVRSNVATVKTGSFDRGHIEFWHPTYTAANAAAVFAASAGTNDWGDTIGGVASGYGSFQIHNPGGRQVVLAYNRWASSTATNDDVGIGNSAGTHPDWTLAANTATYTSRKLVVLLRPKRFNVVFTAVPVNQQVTPRNTVTNLATVPVAGSETLGGFDQAVLKVFRNDLPHGPDLEQDLAYLGGSASFSFSPQIPAELADYTFELHLRKDNVLRLVRRISGITAGDVFLWYGQSNAEGIAFAGNANGYASPWIRTFGMSSDDATKTQAYNFWVEADGNGSRDIAAGVGQWPLVVGRKVVDTQGIPVAILNGSRAGYAMPQLQRDNANPANLADGGGVTRPYNRLRYRALQAKVADKARAIFFYQGESDDNDTAQHMTGFASLMADWKTDYPAVERVFVSQVHVGCGGNIVARELPDLRNAQRLLPDLYDEVRIMSTNGLATHTDNCHFPFTGGYETHGLNSFPQVRRELYGFPDAPAIDPPNPAVVQIANAAGDRLRVVMRKPGAGITVDHAALADFRLVGSTAVLLNATVTDSAIELQYDSPVSGATRLEYLAHIGGGGGWIRNSNGIGLLAFIEPIANDLPQLTSFSPAAVAELAPGTVLPLSAAAASPSGGITRMEILIDGILDTAVNNAASIAANWMVPASGSHTILFRAIDHAGRAAEESVVIFAGSTAAPGGIASGLNLWLRPESGILRDANGAVSSWQDSSGNGHHCNQATAAAKPAYAGKRFGPLPGVNFDGNDFLAAGAGMSTGGYTKIVRVRLSNLSQPGNLLSSGAPSGIVRHALFMSTSALPRLWHNANFAVSATPMVAEQSHLLTGTYDSATKTGTLYLDGQQVGSSNAGANTVDPSYQLGAIAGGNFLTGSIGEAIIYNRVLNPTERASVEAYLNAKIVPPPAAPRLDYATWSAANIAPPADASAEGDANQNGIANLIEFALGLEPATSENPLALEFDGGTVDVRYSRPTDRTGILYELQESTNLETWSTVTDLAGDATAGREERRYQRPATVPGRYYYRLRVTLIP